MNILLTGGAGYIGSHTAAVLANANHEVILFDNFSNSSKKVLDNLKRIIGKPVKFVLGDTRQTKLLSQTMHDYNIDAVIHFAGLKAVGESVSKPLKYFDNNVSGTISLLNAMESNNIKIIVFSSSATVYGVPEYLPIDELHPTRSNNPYGKTKLQIEQILQDLASSNDEWRIACLRYFNPVGAHDSGLIGEDPKGIPNNLMPFISKVAAGIYPYVKVYGGDYETPDGTGIRDYIHILDLAEGHLAAIDFLTKEKGWHAINLGTGEGTSVLEIINHFIEVSGRNIKYEFSPRRLGDVASCYASIDKAARTLNWLAKRDLNSMCRSVWHWQQGLK